MYTRIHNAMTDRGINVINLVKIAIMVSTMMTALPLVGITLYAGSVWGTLLSVALDVSIAFSGYIGWRNCQAISANQPLNRGSSMMKPSYLNVLLLAVAGLSTLYCLVMFFYAPVGLSISHWGLVANSDFWGMTVINEYHTGSTMAAIVGFLGLTGFLFSHRLAWECHLANEKTSEG